MLCSDPATAPDPHRIPVETRTMGSSYVEPAVSAEPDTCSYVPPEPSRIIIDSDGDLCLKVGETVCLVTSEVPDSSTHCDQALDHEHEHPVIFVVCSRTLSRASRVWKRLLYGGFAESKPSCASTASDWVVALPDDNPKAVETILNIIHSRFGALPLVTNVINLDDLYQLTVLTDKYDLTTLLRPWASTWMKSVNEKHNEWRRNGTSAVNSELDCLTWVAWELGDASLFRSASRELALSCTVDATGNLQKNTGTEIVPAFNHPLEPPELQGNFSLSCFAHVFCTYPNRSGEGCSARMHSKSSGPLS
jgi:hypothetical protein